MKKDSMKIFGYILVAMPVPLLVLTFVGYTIFRFIIESSVASGNSTQTFIGVINIANVLLGFFGIIGVIGIIIGMPTGAILLIASSRSEKPVRKLLKTSRKPLPRKKKRTIAEKKSATRTKKKK